MENPKIPKSLFKYESVNTYSLGNLKNAKIYFNRPIDFNDPFDCSVIKESINYTDADVLVMYNQYIKDKNLSKKQISSYSEIPQHFITAIKSSINTVSNSSENEHLYNKGCSCFSEIYDDILMWSHYANGHRGYCLEFDTSFEPFNKAISVIYDNHYPKWNPLELINSDDEDPDNKAMIPLRYKFEHWKHEREWRIFHIEPRKLFGYDVKALKSIYFGLAIDEAHLEIICLVLLGQNPEIKFYKALRDKTAYKVNFEEFIYTRHIDIK